MSQRKTFTFQRREGALEALDKLRAREPSPPSRGEMINLLIERALAQLGDQPEPRQHLPAPRRGHPVDITQADHPLVDEKAVRAVRRGVESALKKRVSE